MLISNRFVTIKKIPLKVDPEFLWFCVPDDKRLHLGDRLFLDKICNALNKGGKRKIDSIDFWLTLAKRMDAVVGPAIGLNFACPIWLSPVERIRFELKKCNLHRGEIFDVAQKRKNIIYCPEYASNYIRIIGLEGRLRLVLDIFKDEGFKITYLGENKKRGKEFDNFVTGISEGHDFIQQSNSYGFLGIDNYWMHVAASYGVRRYILQRRKFLSQNVINHVGVLNQILSVNSEASYL